MRAMNLGMPPGLGRALAFLLMLGLPLGASAACVNENPGMKAGTMHADVNLNLTGEIRAGQHLGTYSFRRDGGTAAIANCSAGSEVYGYAERSDHGVIDGKPTYYVPPGSDYAFALEDLDSGRYFTTEGTSIPFEGPLYPPNVRLHIYAAKDNPAANRVVRARIGGLYIDPNRTDVGYYYTLSTNIQPQVSCSIENNELEIRLPPVPVQDFPQPGYAQSGASGEDTLYINCTGTMTATFKLSSNYGSETINGAPTLLKIRDEGMNGNAVGVGFVLSSATHGGLLLPDNEEIAMGSLHAGRQSWLFKARYYRYGASIAPGLAESSANFVIQFN